MTSKVPALWEGQMKEHWLQWALKEGDASGVGEPDPVLQPAVEGGVDPLLVVWLGRRFLSSGDAAVLHGLHLL